MTAPTRKPHFDLARIRDVASAGSRRFWSSIEELLDEDEFRKWVSAEFPAASSMFDDPGRRQFLKLIGASLLLAGLAGCGETKSDHALPYVNQPDDILPGVPRYYATGIFFEGYVHPVIATTYAGRPTKLDGNPDHPVTQGSSDAFMQSVVFDLYDPERSKVPLRDGAPSTWAVFAGALADLRARWHERNGDGLRILTGATTSPTLIRQIAELREQYPKMRWFRFEPSGTASQDEAMRLAFARVVTPHVRLDQCKVIVSLDHDLLGPGAHQVAHANAWAERRGEMVPGRGRSRLHVAESVPSLTGTVASSRLPCDPSRIAALAQAIGAEFKIADFARPELHAQEHKWLDRALGELRDNAGRSLLAIGPHLDPQLQALAPIVNERLKNTDATVWYSDPIHVSNDDAQPLAALAQELTAGAVDTLITIDCNPAYSSPGLLQFNDHVAKARTRVHAGLHLDETAQLCQWHLPLSHALESWSDGRAVDGSATIIQPVIAPLYASRSIHQLLDLLLGGNDPAASAAVQTTWRSNFGTDFDERWTRALHDGFVTGSGAQPVTISAKTPTPPQQKDNAHDQAEIVFNPDPCVWDGRFANVAWLQELPKPLTKVTWDNVIAISPAIAAQYSFSNGDIAEVAVGGRSVRGPIWIVPGQAPRTVALSFGYGRRAGGDIALGIGYDAFSVRPAEAAWLARGSITRVGGDRPIATTQAHHRIDGFDFVREVTVSNPRTPPPKDHPTMYPDWNNTASVENIANHAWGMVIDLDLCIGCNACISACNVENNVLVVGKDQVARGREMLWLRVDRYYTGDPENPRSYFQPVPCMHCEKAPCEMGCPVHATVHSPEGLNQMVYNRCIGTRTCSSYCPYKVRRFNWYDYRHFAEAEQAVKNPDVTVRSRGVMEKCTYCTQRIEAAHVTADKEGRPLRCDEVVTACQQACPTKAIAFGDLKDEESEVTKRRRSGRHYVLLEDLGTRPRTTYLARWNDSSEREDA
jgi:molybdopterin-containing oxidoreductase family iron-sulfur binding subunit